MKTMRVGLGGSALLAILMMSVWGIGCGAGQPSVANLRANNATKGVLLDQEAVSKMRALRRACQVAQNDSKQLDSDDARLRVIRARLQRPVSSLCSTHLEWFIQSEYAKLSDQQLSSPYFMHGYNQSVEQWRNGGDTERLAARDTDEIAATVLLASKQSGDKVTVFLRGYFTQRFNAMLASQAMTD